MKRSIALLLILLTLIGVAQPVQAAYITGTNTVEAVAAAAAGTTTVGLRIEGKSETVYQNGALTVMAATDGKPALRDVIDSYNRLEGVQKADIISDVNGEHIEKIGALSAAQATWMARVNGENVSGLASTLVHPGDDIVIFYGAASSFQYPGIDLSRMISEGVVRFYDTAAAGGKDAETPIAGAAVVWDGMAYTTDDKGDILIDSTGYGVKHTVGIERLDENGLPTVLRLPAGYSVRYGYADTPQAAWYLEDIQYVTDSGLLLGVSDSEFGPDMPMNRAMFVTVLGRLTGVSVDQTVNTGFTDVRNDGWSAGYIDWAAKSGIAGGYGNGLFGQDDPITREQIAYMLLRYGAMKGIDTGAGGSGENINALSAFADAGSVSGWAAPAVKWAVTKGIIAGYNGLLDPQSPATRAEVSAMLRRFITAYNL